MPRRSSCYICGERNFLEHHHIMPHSEGGSDDKSNIITLCPTCHSAVHHGMYTKEELFRLREFRENTKQPKTKRGLAELPLMVTYNKLTLDEVHALQTLRVVSPVDRLLK